MPTVLTPPATRIDADGAPGTYPVDVRRLGLALGLFAAAFGPALVRVVGTWWDDPEYSHGFLMPPMAAWLLWQERARIRALRGGTSLFAVPLLGVCLLGPITAELHFVVSLAPFAFVGGLFAVLLAFFGWRGAWVFVPALVPLLLGCPLPGLVQDALTLPLKQVSAQFAVGLLQVSSVDAFLDGNVIHLPGTDSLWVADACSGIRSLISLLSLAVLACLVWRRHWALKVLVVLAAVPIAIAVNGLRIWLTGWLSVNVSPEAAAGVFHTLEGFVLFAVAGLLLWGFVGLLGVLVPRSDP
jgi:exosortase